MSEIRNPGLMGEYGDGSEPENKRLSDKETCKTCGGPCKTVKWTPERGPYISTHDELMAETKKLAVKALESLDSLDYLLAKKDDGIDWDGVRALCYDLRLLKEPDDE